MNKEQYKQMQSDQDNLIKRVFSTKDGKELLKRLANEYVYQPISTNENNIVYRRLGKQDLVLLFLSTMYKGELHDRITSTES